MESQIFGKPTSWPKHEDAIGISEEFDVELVLEGYRSGVFPMPVGGFKSSIGTAWWSPLQRGILRPNKLRVTRSMRQSAKRYRTSVDTCFGEVISRCADPTRSGGWIDGEIQRVYTELFERGFAHSIECWNDSGLLVGGLYGVSLGGLFAGESMFHDQWGGRDASKVALLHLVEVLSDEYQASRVIDVQWLTEHLASLGAVQIPRASYLEMLDELLAIPEPNWH